MLLGWESEYLNVYSDSDFHQEVGGDAEECDTQLGCSSVGGGGEVRTALIGLCQLSHEIVMPAFGTVHVDSTAALRVIKRRDYGRMRHVRVGQQWIEEMDENEELKFQKLDGKVGPLDLFIKFVRKKTLDVLTPMMSCIFASGTAASSLKLRSLINGGVSFWTDEF